MRKIAQTVAGDNTAKYSYLVRRYYEVLSVCHQKVLGSQVASYSRRFRETLDKQKREAKRAQKKAKTPGGRVGTGSDSVDHSE